MLLYNNICAWTIFVFGFFQINLQSSKYQSSGPFVVQNDDDDSRNAIFSSNKNDTKKRTRKTCCVIGFGIVLLIVVAVPIIVIATLKKDNTGTVFYYYLFQKGTCLRQASSIQWSGEDTSFDIIGMCNPDDLFLGDSSQ